MHVHFVGKILEFACPAAAAQILQPLQIAAARRRGARQTKLVLLGDDCNSRGFPTHKSTAPSCTNHGRIIDFALVYQRFHVDFGSMCPRCNRWCSSCFIGQLSCTSLTSIYNHASADSSSSHIRVVFLST